MIIVEKELSYAIVGAAPEVHNELGFGFHEDVCARSMAIVLGERGLHVQREVPRTVLFRAVDVGLGDSVETHRILRPLRPKPRSALHGRSGAKNWGLFRASANSDNSENPDVPFGNAHDAQRRRE